MIPHEHHCKAVNHMGSNDPIRLENYVLNKNHFVNFTGVTFVLATHVEGSFSPTSFSGDMKIFFIANIL